MIRGNKLYINITNHRDVCRPFRCMKSDGKSNHSCTLILSIKS